MEETRREAGGVEVVRVVRVDLPFWHLVWFLVRLSFASMFAFVLTSAIWAGLFALVVTLLGALGLGVGVIGTILDTPTWPEPEPSPSLWAPIEDRAAIRAAEPPPPAPAPETPPSTRTWPAAREETRTESAWNAEPNRVVVEQNPEPESPVEEPPQPKAPTAEPPPKLAPLAKGGIIVDAPAGVTIMQGGEKRGVAPIDPWTEYPGVYSVCCFRSNGTSLCGNVKVQADTDTLFRCFGGANE